MTRHFINYYTITGVPTGWNTTNNFEFYQRLGELLEDRFVVQNSIMFHSDIIQPEPEPVFVSYPASKEEQEREREYQLFKGGRK